MVDSHVAAAGSFHAGKGCSGGNLRLIDPEVGVTRQLLPFGRNEAPTAIVVCQFADGASSEAAQFPALVVGCVVGFDLVSRECQSASIKVFIYDEEGRLKLHSETPVEAVVGALCAWSGRLLAGVGSKIRLYTLGRKKLLKRCEYKNLPVGIHWLKASGLRVYASDIREGFHVLQYNAQQNTLAVLCRMAAPRWIACADTLDNYTLIGADKFNCVFVSRVPHQALTQLASQQQTAKQTNFPDLPLPGGGGLPLPGGGGTLASHSHLNAQLGLEGDLLYLTDQCPRFERVCEFHLGDIVGSLQKTLLAPGCAEIVLYGTILGAIGAFLPLQTPSEISLLMHLELVLRGRNQSLVGRDHLAYRSAFFPVKNVIDGDLIRTYCDLSPSDQDAVAQSLNKSPQQLLRLIDSIQSRIL